MAAVERTEERTPQTLDFTLEPWQVLPAYELPAVDFAGVA
jgi:hypothetical protein